MEEISYLVPKQSSTCRGLRDPDHLGLPLLHNKVRATSQVNVCAFHSNRCLPSPGGELFSLCAPYDHKAFERPFKNLNFIAETNTCLNLSLILSMLMNLHSAH